MKSFLRSEVEYRQKKNRTSRFGKWGSLIIKIILILLILDFIHSFNSKSAKNMLWFMSGGNDKYLQENSTSAK